MTTEIRIATTWRPVPWTKARVSAGAGRWRACRRGPAFSAASMVSRDVVLTCATDVIDSLRPACSPAGSAAAPCGTLQDAAALLAKRASVPDLLGRIREEIDTRLAELRALVDEHDRLAAAAEALGDVHGEAAVPAPACPPAQTKPRKTSSARARTRAPRGANRAAVLRAAQERPGATGAELAAVSGVERNTLNALLARLVKSGELQTLALPTGRTGYALGEHAAPSAPST